jgi:hypothetical protein
MKRFAMSVLFLISLSAAAMTHYADGSITLTQQEVANVDNNFKTMEESIKEAVQIIEAQQKMIEELKKGGRCI